MAKITPFLWFDSQAEEAAQFYVSIFNNSRILTVTRYGDAGPGPKGSVMTIEFELDGQRFIGLNGGPHFKFTEAISMTVSCGTQEELDRYWALLTEGGEEVQCGWLKDKFGLSWQVVPAEMGRLMGGSDPEGSRRAMQAMMHMKKLDIAALEKAYKGA